MKRFALGALVSTLACVGIWHVFLSDLNTHTPERVLVGVENYPPLIFKDTKTGVVDGVSLSILKKLPPEKVSLGWTDAHSLTTLLKMLENNEIDVVTSLAKTDERSKFALFTKPYFTIGTRMFYLKADPKVLCVGESFAIESWAKEHLHDMKVVTEKTDVGCVTRVLTGGADAAAMDQIAALIAIDAKVMHLFKTSELEFTYALSYAVSKKRPWLVDMLNAQIDKAQSTQK